MYNPNIFTMNKLILQIKLLMAYLLLVLPLKAQDDPALINITTLAQLNLIRHDLDGDGEVTFRVNGAGGVFGNLAHEMEDLGYAAEYAAAFPGGRYYVTDTDGSMTPATGLIENINYTYKIDPAASYTGYELMNDLDF